jgi:hypothetical protein
MISWSQSILLSIAWLSDKVAENPPEVLLYHGAAVLVLAWWHVGRSSDSDV